MFVEENHRRGADTPLTIGRLRLRVRNGHATVRNGALASPVRQEYEYVLFAKPFPFRTVSAPTARARAPVVPYGMAPGSADGKSFRERFGRTILQV